MPFDPVLAERIRLTLEEFPEPLRSDISEKKMFGGLAFLLRGKMTVGIVGDDLMVRVLGDKMKDVLSEESVRPMDFNKKPMKEFVFVSPEGCVSETCLRRWLELGIEHARHKLNL